MDISPEDEDDMIMKIANAIHKYGMESAAIIMIGSLKPLAFMGSQMGRFFLSPFLPAFGEKIDISMEKFLQIFEKSENVEKLIVNLEELEKGEAERQPKEEIKKPEEAPAAEGKQHKRGWRRFLPF